MNPISSGPTAPGRCPGFTLLEILVVILILTTMTGIAVLTLRGNSAQERLLRSAGEFASLVEFQCESAVLSGRAIRLLPDADGYRFETAGREGWRPPADAALRNRFWPAETMARLETESGAGAANETAILCLPDGSLTPFELHLAATSGEQLTVFGTAAGQVSLQSGPR